MSEATVDVPEIAPVSKIQIKPNFGFLYTPPGILMAVNIVLLFFAWVIMAGWKENAFWSYSISSSISYFLLITVLPFFVLGLLFVVFLFKINTKILINWPLWLFMCCTIWATLLFISSIIVANNARKYQSYSKVWFSDVNGLSAASAFGFFASVGLAIQGLFHFREYRNPVLIFNPVN